VISDAGRGPRLAFRDHLTARLGGRRFKPQRSRHCQPHQGSSNHSTVFCRTYGPHPVIKQDRREGWRVPHEAGSCRSLYVPTLPSQGRLHTITTYVATLPRWEDTMVSRYRDSYYTSTSYPLGFCRLHSFHLPTQACPSRYWQLPLHPSPVHGIPETWRRSLLGPSALATSKPCGDRIDTRQLRFQSCRRRINSTMSQTSHFPVFQIMLNSYISQRLLFHEAD